MPSATRRTMQLGAKGVTAYTCASTSFDISTDAAICTRVYGTLLFLGDARRRQMLCAFR
jgi:hypothetical protein